MIRSVEVKSTTTLEDYNGVAHLAGEVGVLFEVAQLAVAACETERPARETTVAGILEPVTCGELRVGNQVGGIHYRRRGDAQGLQSRCSLRRIDSAGPVADQRIDGIVAAASLRERRAERATARAEAT